ncbi:MAG: CopG family antitoxin [Verrucomicrobiota bacterium]
MKVLEHWEEIPEFEEETDEASYWSEHSLDTRLMNTAVHKQTVRESTTITLRFDPRMLARIKRIARSRYLNYQSMMKQWLSERLEQELKD